MCQICEHTYKQQGVLKFNNTPYLSTKTGFRNQSLLGASFLEEKKPINTIDNRDINTNLT